MIEVRLFGATRVEVAQTLEGTPGAQVRALGAGHSVADRHVLGATA